MAFHIDTLDRLPLGRRADIVRLEVREENRHRLEALGFVPGAQVEALHQGPSGDPTAYRVWGAVIALRACDARMIAIQGV